MGNFFQLPCDGRINFGMLVSVEVRPDRRVRIKKLTALHISEHRAFTFDDDNRLAFEPVAHLREWMPEVLVIQFGERVHF